jgi:hypothetical protein
MRAEIWGGAADGCAANSDVLIDGQGDGSSMPRAFVILCVVGWVWTAIVGVYLFVRIRSETRS